MAKIELFSGPQCGYCERAKALLQTKGLDFEDLSIEDEANRAAFAQRLPRERSIPQIFIDGEHIGGYEDLCILDEKGRLDALTA